VFSGAVRRITTQGQACQDGAPGARGERRVCLHDPEGVLIELLEDSPGRSTAGGRAGPQAEVCCVRVCVHDLDRARRFWVDTLGFEEVTDIALHRPEHEALWHLGGCRRTTLLLKSGETFVELVQYLQPIGRKKPAGYLLSD